MKIIVERDRLVDAVGAATRAAGSDLKIPILNNILLKPSGQSLCIVGTDLDAVVETKTPAEVDAGGDGEAITVNAEKLAHIISRMPEGSQIILEWSDSKPGVSLNCGRSRYKIFSLPAQDFPNLPGPKDAVHFSMPAKDLCAALSAVRFAACKDRTRPHLSGAYMHKSDESHAALGGSKVERLVFAATNGYELARVSVELPAGAAKAPGLILPEFAIAAVIRMTTSAEGECAIAASPTLISFSVGDVVFTSKLIDATFPDYHRAIPANEKVMRADADDLAAALDRLCALGDDKRTKAELTAGSLRLSLVNPDAGEAEEKLEVEWPYEPLTIGVKASGLLAILESMKTDVCALRFSDPTTPVLMNPVKGSTLDYSRSYVSMPTAV